MRNRKKIAEQDPEEAGAMPAVARDRDRRGGGIAPGIHDALGDARLVHADPKADQHADHDEAEQEAEEAATHVPSP